MNKLWIIFIFSFIPFGLTLALDPESRENRIWWAGNETYTIHLHGEMTLSDILDAGIRPRHVPGLGHAVLQFHAKSLSLVFSNGDTVDTKNGYGRIYIGDNNHILNITFYEDYDTGIDEALDRLLELKSVFNDVGLSVEELKHKIDQVRNAEDNWVPDDFGIGKKILNEFWGGSVMAGQSFNPNKPFRFKFTAIRNYKNREQDRPARNPMGVLLEPPKGYAHISFEYVTTPTDPNATPLPYLSPLEQAQLVSKNLEKRKVTLSGEDVIPQVTPTVDAEDGKQNSNSTTGNRLILFISLAICLGIAIGFRIRRA
jgi:hypothetical protein